MMQKHLKKIPLIAYIVGLLFVLLVFNRVISPLPLAEYIKRNANLIPFYTFGEYLMYLKADHLQIQYVLSQIFTNILLFMPIGLFAPLYSDKFKAFSKILIIGFGVSFLCESCQLLLKTGSFDIDDILLNLVGSVLGYAVYKVFSKMIVKHRHTAAIAN